VKIFPLRRIFGRKLLILTFGCLLTFAVSEAAAAFGNIKVGDQAPSIALRDLDGEEHSLARNADTGAVVVLFWAIWSRRSLIELEDLEKFHAEYGDKGLRILAINVESQAIEDKHVERIRSVVQKKKIGFPVVMDDGLKTYGEWGVIATPTTAILDGDGTVTFDLSGYPTGGYFEVDEAIRKVLGLYVPEEDTVAGKLSYEPNRKAMLHFGVGKRHTEKGFMTKALPELSIAAAADPGWVDPRIYLGYIYLREGKYDLAAADLAKAEMLDPWEGREEIRLLRAYLLLAEERVDGAFALLQSNNPVEPEGEKSGEDQPDGLMRFNKRQTRKPGFSGEKNAAGANPEGLADLAEVQALLDESRKGEASKKLEEVLSTRLGDLGFALKNEKKLRAIERMKLMMQQKQEHQ